METEMMIAIGAAALAAGLVIVVAVLGLRAKHQRSTTQTTQLRENFGPEYERVMAEQGRSGGEKDLLGRQDRADLEHVRSLSTVEETRYKENWAAAQVQFVGDPGAALATADHLVGELIAARGYPTDEFEASANALSVDHPRAVQDYRAAHEVTMNNQRNPVPTDDMRAAMVQYGSVITEMTR
jgi:hypothetical protein